MTRLSFGVLGPLEIHDGDRPVPVPPGRRRAVLACLLAHPNRPVPADTLVAAGWGDDLPRAPRSALNTVLSRLRALIGAAVRTEPAGYRLDLAPGDLDATEFERLVRDAEVAGSADARRLLERALALWRGPAFAEFADREFAMIEAARLERMRLDAVEAHAAAAIDTGRPAAAVATLEALLAESPFREHGVRLLMTALYQAGRHTDALDRYRDYRSRLADGLGLDPSPALRDLQARILGHDLPAQRVTVASPSWVDTSTAFIGRDDALAALVAAVDGNRVVTVTGPGGVGKTRLAAEALPLLSERLGLHGDVVELAAVTAGGAAVAIADALRLRPHPNGPVDGLVEYLGSGRHLVVLDNCEHLLDEIPRLVALLARRCPRLRLLATSRRRLGASTELVLPLAPLPVPGPTDAPDSQQVSAAVPLSTDPVRGLLPASGPPANTPPTVADICRRLDGLPLALELAASHAATDGVARVRDRLAVDLVAADSGGLQGAVSWSYRLLSAEQQRLLTILSVFAGDFTVDAVQQLAAHLDSWRGDATRALRELAESSLIVGRDDNGEMTYRLLVIVHTFAARRLAESPDADAARLAHARWVRDLTARLADDWAHRDGAVAVRRLERSSREVTTAVRWALGRGRTELGGAIIDAVFQCLHWTPGLELSELATAVAEEGVRRPGPDMAVGVAAGAFFTGERGEIDRAQTLARAALRMSDDGDPGPAALLTMGVTSLYAGHLDEAKTWYARLATSPRLMAEAHSSLALVAHYAQDPVVGHEHAEIALAAARSGPEATLAFATYAAGELAARADPDRAMALLRESASRAERVGASQVSRVAQVALFAQLVRHGRHDDAAALGTPLLLYLHRTGTWPQLWTMLRVLAELLAATGRLADAAVLLAAADSAAAAPPLMGDDVDRYALLTSRLREKLGDRVFAGIGDLAANLPRPAIIDRACESLDGLRVGHTSAALPKLS